MNLNCDKEQGYVCKYTNGECPIPLYRFSKVDGACMLNIGILWLFVVCPVQYFLISAIRFCDVS